MDKDLFDFEDYRGYLLAWIASQPRKGRGSRAALAEAIGSPISHISQVLSGISNLSFEQAEEMNEFLGHSEKQAEYFLLLVQKARAGTAKLKQRIENQVKKSREQRLVLKDRLNVKATLSREAQALFYSSWHYVAVHILLTIKKYQSKEALAKYLRLSLKKVTEILEFMESIGLVKKDGGNFVVGESRVHLGNDSPMISKHHINWRLQAIQSLEKEDSSADLHYSSVVSISKNDVLEIKSVLVKMIERSKEIIRSSHEEEVHSLCLDFFQI